MASVMGMVNKLVSFEETEGALEAQGAMRNRKRGW